MKEEHNASVGVVRLGVVAIFGGFLVLAVRVACAEEQPRKPMALMVFFDGGRADGLFNSNCPNLRSLIDGTWADGYRCAWSDAGLNIFDAPTLSYPNHSSILCGVTAAKHHVMNNRQVGTKGDKHGHPTWAKRLVAARPELKAHAFFADFNDARIMPDPAVPMTVITNVDWRICDELTTQAAEVAYRRDDAPDAGMFFLSDPDGTGHYCGYYPSSPEYLRAYSECDAKLGRVLAAIRSRSTFDCEDWMIVFTTDHGGRLMAHGPDDGHCHTVPILVVGRHVAQGVLPGCPRTYDLAPTLLAHFGIPADGVDGHIIGAHATPQSSASLGEGLCYREPFDRAGPLSVDARQQKNVTSRWGFADRLFVGLTESSSTGARPVSAGFGRVLGREIGAAFRLQGSEEAFVGARPSFTLTFWMLDEGETYETDPIVMANKNIYSFINHGTEAPKSFPGFAIYLRTKTDDGSRGVTLKYTVGKTNETRMLGAYAPERGQWNFYALSVHADGKVQFYQGRSDGNLYGMAAEAPEGRWNGGPLMVGQDATGQYVDCADLGFDELNLWKRALSTEELRQVFAARVIPAAD